MDAGLQLYNQNGNVQIDSKYKNISLFSKLTVSPNIATSYYADGQQLRYIDVLLDTVQPIVAARCFQECIVWQFLNGSGQNIARVFSNGTAVTLYIFRVGAISGPPYGLEVFNENAELVFSAAAGYPRVLGKAEGSAVIPPFGGSYTFTQPSGKDLALITNRWGRQLQTGPSTSPGQFDVLRYGNAFKNIGTTQIRITGYLLTLQPNVSTPPPDYLFEPSYILVDVTGL